MCKNALMKCNNNMQFFSYFQGLLFFNYELVFRICHCEGDSEVPLIAPCYCAGSLRYVHQACLQQWIKSSDIRSCELCKFQFIMQSKIKPFSEVNLYSVSFWNETVGEDAWNTWLWGRWEMLSLGHFWIYIPSIYYQCSHIIWWY